MQTRQFDLGFGRRIAGIVDLHDGVSTAVVPSNAVRNNARIHGWVGIGDEGERIVTAAGDGVDRGKIDRIAG